MSTKYYCDLCKDEHSPEDMEGDLYRTWKNAFVTVKVKIVTHTYDARISSSGHICNKCVLGIIKEQGGYNPRKTPRALS